MKISINVSIFNFFFVYQNIAKGVIILGIFLLYGIQVIDQSLLTNKHDMPSNSALLIWVGIDHHLHIPPYLCLLSMFSDVLFFSLSDDIFGSLLFASKCWSHSSEVHSRSTVVVFHRCRGRYNLFDSVRSFKKLVRKMCLEELFSGIC